MLKFLASAWGICLCAFTLRLLLGLALLSAWGPAFPLASDDGDLYNATARWLLWGDRVVHDRLGDALLDASTDPAANLPTGYWLFLAAQYRLWGHQHLSAVVLQSAIGALGVLAAYRLAQRLLPRRPALVAGYGMAASSTLVYLSAALYAESIYVPLIYGGLWLTVLSAEAGRGPRGRWMAFAAGAIFGIAEATRPVAVLVFAAAMGWILWQSRRDRSSGPSPVSIGALAAGFMASLLPFALRDLVVLGHVATFTSRGSEAFYASPLGRELAYLGIDPYQTGVLQALVAALQQPLQLAEALVRTLPVWFSSTFLVGGWAPVGEPILQLLGNVGVLMRVVLWLVIVLGLAWLGRRPAPRLWVGGLLLATVLATHLPFISLGGALVRYRSVADPIFIISMVAGATALYARLRRTAGLPLAYVAPAATG